MNRPAAIHLAFMRRLLQSRGRRSKITAVFRRRLTLALALLAAAAVAEGLLALWTVGVAQRQVERGRVASDIQLGFVELSATKQRLRSWVAQHQMDAAADPEQRDRLQADLQRVLARLRWLSLQAISLDDGATTRREHAQRQDALDVLARSFAELRGSIEAARPLRPGTDARAAWLSLSDLFDISYGRDLRQLLAESIAREAAAVARERAAADATLGWTRALWAMAAATLALGALLSAWHFTRALRRPLDELSEGVQALQRGELQHRIAAGGADEFSAVARGLNTMAEELAQHRDRESKARLRLEELVQARTSELEDALRALREVDARRRQLFADISHELRTPTTAIRGEAEVTLRGNDKAVDEYKSALARIVESSRQLSLVIDDLLTMARSDIDALALQRRPLDLAAPLAEAVEQARALAHERSVRIEAEAPAEALPLLGDPQRLRQLLMVLLDNAVRYSHPGGIVRAVVRRLSGGDGAAAEAELEVIDEGIGIAAEDLPRVFERNFRGERARRHRADGSGLGLAIGAALARAHGGEIRVDSRAGAGTRVTLRLPLLGGAREAAVAT